MEVHGPIPRRSYPDLSEGVARVVMTIIIPGIGDVSFTSERMNDAYADLVLWELARVYFRVERAHKVQVEDEP